MFQLQAGNYCISYDQLLQKQLSTYAKDSFCILVQVKTASSFNINAAFYHGISVFLHSVYSPAAQSSVLVPPVSHCMNSRQAHCLAY